VPEAVHVTFVMGILSLPEIRFPPAATVRVTVLDAPVLALAVTVTEAGVDEIEGVVSGSALAKLTEPALKVSLALFDTVAFIVKVPVSEAAIAAAVPQSIMAANIRVKVFRVFILLSSVVCEISIGCCFGFRFS
jgi:hypothetical protein